MTGLRGFFLRRFGGSERWVSFPAGPDIYVDLDILVLTGLQRWDDMRPEQVNSNIDSTVGLHAH